MSNKHPEKLYGLDHLRALAILMVFMFHYQILSHGMPIWLPDIVLFGWTGVDLFFVLSGFLISSQLFAQISKGQLISFKEFFLKRFFRIIPPFMLVLVIYFCVPFFREKESLPPLWKFLTFTQNFGLDLQSTGAFSHAWSLCVEEHLYLFLPIILIVLQFSKQFKKAYWMLIVLFFAGFISRIYSFEKLFLPHIQEPNVWMYWYKYVYYPTYNRLDGLLFGVAIAAVYRFSPAHWNKISKYGNLSIILGILVLTAAYFMCEETRSYNASIFGFPLVAMGYGCMVIGAISPSSFLYKWKSTSTTFIATLSYSIYLLHKGIIHMVLVLFSEVEINHNLILIMSIIGSIIAALVLRIAVEKPFLELRNKFLINDRI